MRALVYLVLGGIGGAALAENKEMVCSNFLVYAGVCALCLSCGGRDSFVRNECDATWNEMATTR